MLHRCRPWLLMGCSLWLSWGLWALAATPPRPGLSEFAGVEAPQEPSLTTAFRSAGEAAALAQTATTPAAWGEVAALWAEAIQHLQQVPPGSPQRIFAQRKAREYLSNLAIAQQHAEASSPLRVFPPLGSAVLDEQLGVYLSYVATFGAPDILVIGSSRALQGIDPQVLQQALRGQGLTDVRVYTFGVNGSTAQVVSFILRQLLRPEQLPRMIVWADGSRAFNSGRVDLTFAAILASPGYRALQGGAHPALGWGEDETEPQAAKAASIAVTAINGYGFLPVAEVFDPLTYYQRHPRVSGQYDSSYQPFELAGVQTVSLRAIASFTKSQGIPLVFVNLPLSRDYLDATRLGFEQQFRQYLQQEAQLSEFVFVDFLEQWLHQNQLFADPSHLNRDGAIRIAQQLAATVTIPWDLLRSNPGNPEAE